MPIASRDTRSLTIRGMVQGPLGHQTPSLNGYGFDESRVPAIAMHGATRERTSDPERSLRVHRSNCPRLA